MDAADEEDMVVEWMPLSIDFSAVFLIVSFYSTPEFSES